MAVHAASAPGYDAFPRGPVRAEALNGAMTDPVVTAPVVVEASVAQTAPAAKVAAEANVVRLPHVEVVISRTAKDNPAARRDSQALYTRVYLKEKYVKPEELTDGLFIDEYDSRSTYLYAENGRKTTTIRQIRADKSDGLLSLPTAKNFELDPDALRLAAEVDSLVDLKPREVVEISGLASDEKENGVVGGFDATLSIYSTMLRLAVEQGHKLWLQNTTPKVIAQLSMLIGRDQLHKIGEPKMYMGSVTTPIAINPLSVIRKLLGSTDKSYDFHKNYLREAFKGIDARKAPKDIRELLESNDIEHRAPSLGYRAIRNKHVVAQAGILAYTGARAIPVANLDGFHGEAGVFWAIDAATAPTYTYGVMLMYNRKASLAKKAFGALIAGPSLIAPYVYMYAKGENYPPYVNAIVGALITGAAAKDSIGRVRRSRREAKIHEALQRQKPEEA